MPEYQFINYLAEDYTRSIQLSFTKQTTGKNDWELAYHLPSYGLQASYNSLGNKDAFGQEIALVPFFRINLLRKNRLAFYNQTGLGFSYVTRKFDLVDNFQNVAVGSHFNFHLNLQLAGEYLLNSRNGSLLAGVQFDHFSNANTAEPNLGLNYISYFIGYSHFLGERDYKQLAATAPEPHEKKVENELVINIGGKHSRALSSNYYLTSSISYEKRKSFWRALHLGVGGDLFYDTSIEDQYEGREEAYKKHYQFQTGIHISQSIVYDKFSITLQEGIYIGLTERIEEYVMYNRGILKYWVSENFSVRLTMKSHLHILDYPEIGLGIKL